MVGKMLSDSAIAPPPDDDQPVYVSDLLSCAWLRHPETRMFYHQSKQTISFYYNGRVSVLPRSEEMLYRLQQLCANREWSVALINECLEIESMEALLIELASNHAVIPIND